MPTHTTRLAPSPTGALHLGNARTFIINWALARRHGWRVVLRLEDLDTPRVKPGAAADTIAVLAWLGLDWDERVPDQSSDLSAYADAMGVLAGRGLTYPCEMTRSEIESAASAPHGPGEHAPRTRPGTMPRSFADTGTNWRFATPPGCVSFDDRFAGRCVTDPAAEAGDFPIWTQRGTPAYQLAVVVDDHRQNVTRVVRGNDLIGSAGRQLLLYRALEIGPEPEYTHLPLVRGADGRRLAKRHGDTRLETYRGLGVPPGRVLALLARWSGVPGEPDSISAAEFAERFDLRTMPTEDVVFSAEDDRWLRCSSG